MCEAGTAVWSERIEMSRQEYEALRVQPTHVVLEHGHQAAGVEDVIGSADAVLVVANYCDAETVAAAPTRARTTARIAPTRA